MNTTENTITFLHSGDSGDIVAGLATVKELCEQKNAKATLVLDTTGGHFCNDDELNNFILLQNNGRNLKFNDAAFDFLVPLIEMQSYIDKVIKWDKDLDLKIDYNLNNFRKSFCDPEVAKETNQNLLFLHQKCVGLEFKYPGPWLTIDKAAEDAPEIIVSRSPRVHSAYAYYASREQVLKSKITKFIGLDFEYELFEKTFRYKPDRYEVKTAVDMARAIKGSKAVIVNSTLLYWIAVGLGHGNIFHEIAIDVPTSYFPNQKPNTIHYIEGMHFVS